MHGYFPRIIYKLKEPDRKCVLYVLTTCTRKPIHMRKKLVLVLQFGYDSLPTRGEIQLATI